MNCCGFFIKSFIYFFWSSQELYYTYFPWLLSSCRLNLLLGTFCLFLHLLIRKPFSHWAEEWPHHHLAGIVTGCHLQCSTEKHNFFYLQLKCAVGGGRSQEGVGVAGILDKQSLMVDISVNGVYRMCAEIGEGLRCSLWCLIQCSIQVPDSWNSWLREFECLEGENFT